ncbi:putative Zn-dependent protease [Caulobacter ginsengisoli]|uniref:Zn-dependent protease n=1 Tax=Caulobacter ginsengisoli TaxID=400775 RepID=A0ABU0J071_9CAUL|nr:M48 family metallopeptidase [Caulobacter ginsengisoli]MDQ0466828.1 putative Zn-dependent protease [Caulobacter ginsengisoli]
MRLRNVLLAASAWAVAVTPVFAEPRPPHSRPVLSSDEGGIWDLLDRAELDTRNSAELDKDPVLNAYVQGVVCKVAGDYCADLRVYLLDRPYLNAITAPNGYVEVWSGLMLRAETESELAFVLGHEITHFTENHGIEQWRKARAQANVAMLASIVSGPLGLLAALGAAASLSAYSREDERQADREGLERAVAAGYDAGGGAAMWTWVIDEAKASDFKKVREGPARASIFNTHPIDQERIATLTALAKGRPAGAGADKAVYRAVIRPHLASWLRDDLRRRDYGQSLYLIQRLSQLGTDMGVLNYFKGEAYRLRRGAGDDALAQAAYEAAVTQIDVPPEAFRELGNLYVRAGDKARARTAFESYLSRAPEAQDRWLVETSLKTLEGT